MANTTRAEGPTTPLTSSGNAEVERLRAEVASLRAQLDAAQSEQSPSMHRVEPKFSMSEGERLEIESRGSAVSPFTGQLRTADSLPAGIEVEQSDKAREDGRKAAQREAERLAAQRDDK